MIWRSTIGLESFVLRLVLLSLILHLIYILMLVIILNMSVVCIRYLYVI